MTDVRRQAFPSTPASCRDARRFVDSVLSDGGLADLAYTATMLVSELVANAVLHAGSPLEVVVRLGADGARIEVHDGSRQPPVRKNYSDMSGTGRGLLLVERMATGWGSEPRDSGKVVWFDLEASATPVFDVLEVDAL